MLVLSLLLGLLGILSAQRERRQNVAVLIDSSVTSSHKLFIGQWLGIAFAMLNLLIVLHLLVTLVMLVTGVRPSIIAFLKSLIVICFPWALFMVTIGFVLGSFTPIFISLPAVGGVWYATSVLGFFGRLGEWLPAPWEALVDPSTISTASASISFGFLPVGRIITNRMLYLGVSLLVVGIGALFYKKSRENRFSRGVIGLSLLGFIATIAAISISWGQFLATTTQGFGSIAPPDFEFSAVNDLNQVQVVRYEIDLNIPPDGEGLFADVLMSIRNTGEQATDALVFILNDNLVIKKMVALEGNGPLEWQKYEGGYYRVQMVEPLEPGQETRISAAYYGSISQWYSPGWRQQPEPLAFLNARGIVLPTSAHWYPVLQTHVVPTQWGQARARSAETQFSIRVEGHSQPLIVNLPQIRTGFWEGMTADLFLASANWHDVEVGDFHLWYTPGQGESADLLIKKLNSMYKTCESYLGKTSFETIPVITVPENLYAGLKDAVVGEHAGVIFVTDTRLDLEARVSPQSFNLNGYQHELFLQMLGLWINPHSFDRGDQRYGKSLAIASYMWTLFRNEFPGLPGTIAEEKEFRTLRDSGQDPRSWAFSYPLGLTFPVLDKAENELWFEFDRIRQQDGDSALKPRMQDLLSELCLEGGS